MSAETSGDVCHINDEDTLRKMWQDTEDFGKKKEIRSHMYKLREERLRNFYSSSDPGTEIHSTRQSPGFFNKSPNDENGSTHADSLMDHSFLSLKSKEVRDSESPTKDIHHFRINDKNRGGNQGWDVVSKKEISSDGKTHTSTKLATTQGTEKIDKGVANYSAKCEEKSSVYEDGDANNFTKSAATASKSVLQQEAKGGDDNNSFRTYSTSSSSSSKVVSQHRSNSDVKALPTNETDTSGVVIRKSYTTDVPVELKRNPNYIDGNTTVTTETRTLPDGTKVTTTRYETKGVSSKVDKQQCHTEQKTASSSSLSSTSSTTKTDNDRQSFRQQPSNEDNQQTTRIEIIRNTTDHINQKPNAAHVHEVRKTTDTKNIDESVRITQNQDIRKTTHDNHDDVYITKVIREKEYNPRDRQPTTTDEVYVTKVIRENEYTSPQPAQNLPKTSQDNRGEVYITKIIREQNYIPTDEQPTSEIPHTKQDSVTTTATHDVHGKTTTATKTTKTTHEDQYQTHEKQLNVERIPSDTKQPSDDRKPEDNFSSERKAQDQTPVDRKPEEFVPTVSPSCKRITSHHIVEDIIPVKIRPHDQTPQQPDRYMAPTPTQPDLNGDQIVIERTTTTTTVNNRDKSGPTEKKTTVTSNTTYKTDYTTKRISVDISPTHDAFARSLRASPDRDKRRGSVESSTTSLRSSISPEKVYPYSKHPDNRSLDRKQPTKLSPTGKPRQDFREASPIKKITPTFPTGRVPKKSTEDINTNTITRRHKTDIHTEENRTTRKSVDSIRDKPRNRDNSIDGNILARPSRIRPRSRSVSPTISTSDIEFIRKNDTVTDLDDDITTITTTTAKTKKQTHTTSRPKSLDVVRHQPVTHHPVTSPTKQSPTKEKPQDKPLKRRDTYEDRCRHILGINTDIRTTTETTSKRAETLPSNRKSPERKVEYPKKDQPKIQEYPAQIRRVSGSKKPQDTPDYPTENEAYVREIQQTTHKTIKKDSPGRYNPTDDGASPDRPTGDSKPKGRKPRDQSPDKSSIVTQKIDQTYSTTESVNRQTKTDRTSPGKRPTTDVTKPKGPTDKPDDHCTTDASFEITFTTTRPSHAISPDRTRKTPELTDSIPNNRKPTVQSPERSRHVTDETLTGTTPSKKSPERQVKTTDEPRKNKPRESPDRSYQYTATDESAVYTSETTGQGDKPNRNSPDRVTKIPEPIIRKPLDRSPDRPKTDQCYVTNQTENSTITTKASQPKAPKQPEEAPKSRVPRPNDKSYQITQQTTTTTTTTENLPQPTRVEKTPGRKPSEQSPERPTHVSEQTDEFSITDETIDQIFETTRIDEKSDGPKKTPEDSTPISRKPTNKAPERPSYVTNETNEYYITNQSVDRTLVKTGPGNKPNESSPIQREKQPTPKERKPYDQSPERSYQVTDETVETIDRTISKRRPNELDGRPTKDDSIPKGRRPTYESPERSYVITEQIDEHYIANQSVDRNTVYRPDEKPERSTPQGRRPSDQTKPKGRQPQEHSPERPYGAAHDVDQYCVTTTVIQKGSSPDRSPAHQPRDEPKRSPTSSDRPERIQKGAVPVGRQPKGHKPEDQSPEKPHSITQTDVTDDTTVRKTTITKNRTSPDRKIPTKPKEPTGTSPDRPYIVDQTDETVHRTSQPRKRPSDGPNYSKPENHDTNERYTTTETIDRVHTTTARRENIPERPRKPSPVRDLESPDRTESNLRVKPRQVTEEIDVKYFTDKSVNRTVTCEKPDDSKPRSQKPGDFSPKRSHRVVDQTDDGNAPEQPEKQPVTDKQPRDRRSRTDSPEKHRPVTEDLDEYHIRNDLVDYKTVTTKYTTIKDRRSPDGPRKQPTDEPSKPQKHGPDHTTDESVDRKIITTKTKYVPGARYPDKGQTEQPGRRPSTGTSKPKSKKSPERYRVTEEVDIHRKTVTNNVNERPDKRTPDKNQKVTANPSQPNNRKPSNQSPDRITRDTEQTDEYVGRRTVTSRPGDKPERKSPVKKVYTTTITKTERNVEHVGDCCSPKDKPQPSEKIVSKANVPSSTATKKPTKTEPLSTKVRKPVDEVYCTTTNTYLTTDKSTVHRLVKPDPKPEPRKKQPDAIPLQHKDKKPVSKPTRELNTKTDSRKYEVATHKTMNNVRKSEEYTSDEDTLVENVENTDEDIYRDNSPDRICRQPGEDDFYTLNIKVYRNDANTRKVTKPKEDTEEETDSEIEIPQSPQKSPSKPKTSLPRTNQSKPDKIVYRTEEKHFINKTAKKPIRTVSPNRNIPSKQIPKTTRTVTNHVTTRDSKITMKTKPKPDVTRHVVTTTIQVVPKTKKPSQKAPLPKFTKATPKPVKITPRLPSDDDSEVEEYVVDGEDFEETNRSYDRQITRTISSPKKSRSPVTGKPDHGRRPDKVITTKSIVINYDLEQEKEVVVNLQRSKSSREATPDRSYAYPASDSEDKGIPRYPDQISEPDDGYKRKVPTKLSDIPIIETDADFPQRTLNKVDDTDECLLTVNEKVSKFVNEADKLTKLQSNKKQHETDFYKTVTKTNERLNVVQQIPDRPKSPKCENYPDDDDEEVHGSVSKKVSHFIETAEKIKTQQKSTPPPKVSRPEFTNLDERIRTDDCLLSVSDKVSKFTTVQSQDYKKPVSLAKIDVSTIEPPLMTTECVQIDSEEDTYIRKPSPDTYSRSYNSGKSPDESVTEPDTTPKSSRKDSEPKIVLSTTSRLRSTESIRRAKEIFENIAKDQTVVNKSHRPVSKPAAGHKPTTDDVKLSKIGVYDNKPRKSQPDVVDVEKYDLKSTRLIIDKINRSRSPTKDDVEVPGYLRPLDRSPRPHSPYKERSQSPNDRSRSPSHERGPKPHDPSLDNVPHYMWPLDRSVHEHEHSHESVVRSPESSPSCMTPLDKQVRAKSPTPTPKDVTDKPSKYGNVTRKGDSEKVCTTTTRHRKFSTVEIENILTTHEIEEIYDIEILEVLLEWAANYEQRRRVRSQIRVVKQLTTDNKLPTLLLKKNQKLGTTKVKEPSVERTNRTTSSKKVEEHSSYTYERRRSSEIKSYTREISPETKVVRTKSPDRKTETKSVFKADLKRIEPVPGKKIAEEKPSWVTQRSLKKPSGDLPKTKSVSTTKKQEPRVSPAKDRKPTDVITSSYGVGPTDENGSPLFGLKALRAQTRTGTTKVQGTVIKSHYYSENGHEPTGEVSVTKYSTDPNDFEGGKHEPNGLLSVTTTQKFGTKGTPSYKAIVDRRDHPEDESIEEYESRKTTLTRRGSVKQMSKKFIENAVETSKSERQSSYPKAGLILRTSSFKASPDSRESSPENSAAVTTTTVRKTTTSSSTSGGHSTDTFLNNQTRVRNVQDVITRMKNADDDVQEGDTADDVEARKLLNKFIGSQVILSGMESHTSSSPTTTNTIRRTTTTTTTTSKGSGKPTVVTRTFTHPIAQEDLDTIWDEPTLKLLLERSTEYEERRIIRGRLRDVMAEKEVCADVVSKTSEESSGRVDETVGKIDGPATTTQVTTRVTSHQTSKKPLSPFAKFRQLDKQNSLNTPPGTPRTPTGSTPLFKFTDPELNRQASTVKERLLQWCQMKTKEYENVQLDNFSSSWADGLAFCALIHHFKPDAFDYHALTPKDRRHNFTLAFRIADEKADIVPLLDVDDMVATRKPDWKCVFTYVQTIYARFKNED